MKWMCTYATIVILPFTYKDLAILPWAEIPATTWFETAFVVFVATYLAYIMMMTGQKLLRPSILSMYSYVHPIVACIVSVATGLGVFGWSQGAAVLLVFGGVWLVTQSKSRADLKTDHPSHTAPESCTAMPTSSILWLQQQRHLLELEYEYEKAQFRAQTETAGVTRKI